MDSVRGQLLIASPALEDLFRRAVVLVVEHGEEGAFGLLLNHRSESTVGEAVPELGVLAADEDPVWIGGPVSPSSVIAMGDFERPDEAATLIVGDVGLVSVQAPRPSLRRTRVFAGYTGWGPSQLDGELEQEAWITEPALPDDPFVGGDLWARVLRRKGGQYELLARMPVDPAVN